jgi:hypothetical protein
MTLQSSKMMCPHRPKCPDASAADRAAARTAVGHPDQGWSLLCNGVILFEDTGELLPSGAMIAPHRPTDLPLARLAASGIHHASAA